MGFCNRLLIYCIIYDHIAAAIIGIVFGCCFSTLSETLFAIDILPTEGLGLLIAIYRSIYLARFVTNVIGNSVATIVQKAIKPIISLTRK